MDAAPLSPSSGSGSGDSSASYTASLFPTPSSSGASVSASPSGTFPCAPPLVGSLALRRQPDGVATVPLLEVLHQWAAAAGAPPLPLAAAAGGGNAAGPSPTRIALDAAEAARREEEGRLAALLPAAPLAVQAEAEALRHAFVQRTSGVHSHAQAFLARRVAIFQPLLQATGAGAVGQPAEAYLGPSVFARVDAALTAIARGHMEQMRALRLRCEAAPGSAPTLAFAPTPTALMPPPPPPPPLAPAPMAVAIEAEHAAFAAMASQPTQETDAETQGTQQRPPTAASSSATAAPKGGAEAEVEAGDATAKPKKGKGKKKKKGPGGGAGAAAPQAAKDVLTGWLARHWTDPYPEEAELEALAAETGLPVDQVRTWMMNARCRTWKPRNQRAYHEALAQDSAKPLLQLMAAVPASDGCKRMLQRLQCEAKAGASKAKQSKPKPKPQQEEEALVAAAGSAAVAVMAEQKQEQTQAAVKPFIPLLEQPLIIWEEGGKRRAKAKALSRFAHGQGGGGGGL